MTLIPSTLVLLAATCLVMRLLIVRVRLRRKEGFVEISPRYRPFFRQFGVTKAADFLALPGETPHIVSGHPDRNVARITLAANGRQWNAFLKCEHRVTWRIRVSNAVAGFGLVSRSLREAWTLQALQREGLPGPEWLAAGEDGQGRAFLLVREAPGMELRAVLAAEREPRQRQRIARRLGATLARLHTAGFHHPDLYAHHLLLDCHKDTICLLDWQRACLRSVLPWHERGRGLAALHASVDDALATPEERLLFLRAYWRSSSPLGVSWQAAVQKIEAQARRLLRLRHIREKRQPPVPQQAWICLDGEALCVTPALQQRCGEQIQDYLSLRSEEDAAGPSLRRRWPALPDAARTLLVRRTQRTTVSPEQRQAALLLRLQRHGIIAPQVLALGQHRADDGRVESFLLTEPLTQTCSLEAWLAYRTRRRTRPAESKRSWSVLRQAGALLRRLHEASCYLDFGPAGCGLAVHQADGKLDVVLDNVNDVTPRRRRQPRRAARDLRRMQQMFRWAGCSRSDLGRFRAGYLCKNPKSEIRNPKEIQKKKSEIANRSAKGIEDSINHYGLVFPSDFGFRISDFSLWRRLLLGVRRWRQRSDWPRFVGPDWTERIMDVAITDRFHAKQGRATGRWIIAGPTEERARHLAVYLKRHYELPWWRGWLATLWPRRNWSPAWREWQQLESARRQGIPVPRPIAVAEYVGPWGQLRSCLAVEELAGMVSLQEAIPLAAVRQDAQSFRHWKHGLVAEMARLTRMLHDRRCFHKDLYLCHIFIAAQDTHEVPAEGWRGRLHLIDLHRLNHHSLLWRVWQTKDLAELLYASSIIGVDARDRLAFWRAYRGDGPHRPRCWWTRWFILYRWRRYRRHNARRLNALDLSPYIGDSRPQYESRLLS
jgi:tRNA A-37 threonylcarbamoyl transferase component Bud32